MGQILGKPGRSMLRPYKKEGRREERGHDESCPYHFQRRNGRGDLTSVHVRFRLAPVEARVVAEVADGARKRRV
jgi:hypothetical protein